MNGLPFIVFAFGAGAVLWGVSTYNRLVRLRNHCIEAWSNIDTELKRRYDLIPNLVQAVKGYARHEHELLEQVARLREFCRNNHGTPRQQAATENQLVHVLSHLMARVENYPDLKAGQNFLELQQELVDTEDRIQAARRFYNGNVRENNNLIETFPSNIVAGLLGMRLKEYFELDNLAVRGVPPARF